MRVRRTLKALFVSACGLALVLSAGPVGPFSSTSILRPYVPESPHKAYGVFLAQQGSGRSASLLDWLHAAESAILEPTVITLPFETESELDAIEPGAAGYVFSVDFERRVQVELHLENGAEHSELFVDLFRRDGDSPEHITSAPPLPLLGPAPLSRQITLEPSSDGEYIVRVQPGLSKRAGGFRLAIRTEPALQFPVSGHNSGSIQSGFGAARDGGSREHHGVDIFAARGTPVLASLDARVSRVETTGLGGNVVWLQPLFSNTRLYYAHLDSQSVVPGQYIFAGETIGTVGNTGNARTTPPHLHFGVYIRNRGGPRDPYPFLK